MTRKFRCCSRSVLGMGATLALISACEMAGPPPHGAQAVEAVEGSGAGDGFSVSPSDSAGVPASPAGEQNCPQGLAGPRCDIACSDPQAFCTVEVTRHGDGRPAGLSGQRTVLFDVAHPESSKEVLSKLQLFIERHAETLGLLEKPAVKLSLAQPPEQFGKLFVHRFVQDYRGIPLLGPESLISVSVSPKGAISISGGLVDSRQAFASLPRVDESKAETAMIAAVVTENPGLAHSRIRVENLRLVAHAERQTLAYAGTAVLGLEILAEVVVSAVHQPQVLLYDPLVVHGMEEQETAISVRAEDFGSNLWDDEVSAEVVNSSIAGAPLRGVLVEPSTFQLANSDLFVMNAEQSKNFEQIQTVASSSSSFLAEPGTAAFAAQDLFYKLQNMYEFMDGFMHGRWDSVLPLVGKTSDYQPGTFKPRFPVAFNVPSAYCHSQPGCAKVKSMSGSININSPWALMPEQGAQLESLIQINFTSEQNISLGLMGHEFGHAVDFHAYPGTSGHDLGCYGDPDCQPRCLENTSDEADPLAESVANLFGIILSNALNSQASFEQCNTFSTQNGTDVSPHNSACKTKPNSQFSWLARPDDVNLDVGFCNLEQPTSPGSIPIEEFGQGDYNCDKPSANGYYNGKPTGLCGIAPGYKVASLSQAFWELMYGQHCESDYPFTCSLDSAAPEAPADVAINALLYALKLNSLTYNDLIQNIGAYYACNAGEQAYGYFNRVACHHGLLACDETPPVLGCNDCGNNYAEIDESCDGNDLKGQSCEGLGLDDGELSCTASCTINTSQCGADSDEPTTGNSPGSNSATAGETEGEGFNPPVEQGCGCQVNSPSWPASLVFGALSIMPLWNFRRKNRAFAGSRQ